MSRSPQKISVALCTFNGERFLSRQLASMQQQTRLPDELVICDDCSTDNTVEILQDFASSAGFPVKLTRNESNLGFVANFERAIQLCQGDLIALSDQDDIWDSMRLQRSEEEFLAHPEVGLIFSDADIIDDQDQPTGSRLWQNFGFAGERKQRLLAGDYTVLAKNRFVTGATVMFRSRLRDNCLPIGSGWLHDEWIAATAAAVSDLMPIDAPLIRYRRHTSQQVGLSPASSLRKRHRLHWSELATADRPAGSHVQPIVATVVDPARRGALCQLSGPLAICPLPLLTAQQSARRAWAPCFVNTRPIPPWDRAYEAWPQILS